MNKSEFITFCGDIKNWESASSDIIKSLIISNYSDAKEILLNAPCVNFMKYKEVLSDFLVKTIKGDPIGSLVSDENKLFSELCKSWLFDANFMEYAQGNQIDECAKYYINYANENFSYEISEGKKRTFFEYVIELIEGGEYSNRLLKILVNKCANLITSDISNRTEKYK